MNNRLISCMPSEALAMNGKELKQAILASEGRVVMTENVVMPGVYLMPGLTNAEISAAFGSDLILLNGFDCFHPDIPNLPATEHPIQTLRELCGRPVGCNLEPVVEEQALMSSRIEIAEGRKANAKTYQECEKLGIQFICLTGNPGTGVTNAAIEAAIRECKANFSGLIIAGKMHSSGVDEPVVDIPTIRRFIEAGADVILMPAPGTVPGLQASECAEACKIIREAGCLSLSAIGTSQESSSTDTIRDMALLGKQCGFDIQHIGDAGWGGMALPENIMAMSIAIRGIRHTYFEMAKSARR